MAARQRAKRQAMAFALVATLHDPTAHAARQESAAEAGNLGTPDEQLTGLW
jgi:hypothetical protein